MEPGPILHDEGLRNELKATAELLAEICISSTRRASGWAKTASPSGESMVGEGGFGPMGKERGRGSAEEW